MNFVAPDTKRPLLQKDYDTLVCPESKVEYFRVDGVWRMLAAERRPLFERFVREYETVRLAEGRQEDDDRFYRQLPAVEQGHPAEKMWQQRAKSFDIFVNNVLKNMETDANHPLKICDMGAGNGWLSNRLAARGHELAAVDLTINDFDGLAVHGRYEHDFVPIQAEFDRLPLDDGQFDLVIFNASFHYSTDFSATLSEAFRIIQPDGRVVIIDTPVYAQVASGRQMVAEREAQFEQKFGVRGDGLPSENFLTHKRVNELESQLSLASRSIQTVPDFRRAVRRLKRSVRGEREAAAFPILVFKDVGLNAKAQKRKDLEGTHGC